MFLWIHFKKKLRGISEIEKFYMEDCPNTAGYTLEYILGQSDSWLEQKHDYIQWLFPTAKSSCFNPKAPVISQKSADKLIQKYGDALKEKIIKSFFRMAKFYGFRVFYIVGSSVVVEPDDMLEKGWLSKGNHNFLRLTRIMESLQLFGLDNHYKALKECLLVIAAKYPEIIGEKTRTCWEDC